MLCSPRQETYSNCLYWWKYVRDINGATQKLKATVLDRRVWTLHLPVLSLLCAWARYLKTRTTHSRGQAICMCVRPASTKDCTSGNETRTQNACASVPIRIVSYSYTLIVPCTVLYDVRINVACKTLSKYFIQVLSFVTLVHITQTATRLVQITHCIHETNFKILLPQPVS